MKDNNKGGRPPVTDADSIAMSAVALFETNGFVQTTMDEIAATLGIGRTTLFRYFPSKAAILWHHHDTYAGIFQTILVETPEDVRLVDAPFRAYALMIDRKLSEAPFIKAMMMVIVRSGPDATGNWTRFGDWAGYISAFLASRRGGSASDFANEGQGLVIWSALWTGITRWAFSEDERPERFLAQGRALLNDVKAADR